MTKDLQPDPRMRVDILVLRLAELLTKRYVQPHCTPGSDLWSNVKPVVERKLIEAGVPDKPITLETLCEQIGILKPKRRRLRRVA